jgi:hypothetical protein
MPDHNKMSEEDKNKKGGEFKMPPRTWFVWIAIICTVVGLEFDRPRDHQFWPAIRDDNRDFRQILQG